MSACLVLTGPQNYWIQGYAHVDQGMSTYQLTAPLESNYTMYLVPDPPLTATPPLAKKLVLTGAPFFVINATATLYSHSENHIDLGISKSDEIINISPALPPDTIVYNLAYSPVGASAFTVVQTCVPPGTYYVSCSVTISGVGPSGTAARASLAINVTSILSPDAQASAVSLPATLWSPL